MTKVNDMNYIHIIVFKKLYISTEDESHSRGDSRVIGIFI